MKKLLFVCLLFVGSLLADEGMWMMSQLKTLELNSKGLKIDVKEIYNPDQPCILDAVVNLGGASAELVSPDGLLLTNHHVAFGAVQRASTQGTDYITNGFLALSRQEEIAAPGYTARIIQKIEDVTDRILAGTGDLDDLVKKQRLIEERSKALTDEIEGDREDLEARVAEMFGGRQYVLFVYKVFEDVRIVYVPPQSIGNYGADIDNWMWPRHTGDFSFLRIYTAPDGSGAKYSEDNVPYHPKRWLKIADQPLREGDFTFIVGFPGRTTRYRTSASVDYYQNYQYPNSIKNFSEVINLLDEKGKESQILSAKVAGFSKGLNNAMKNYQGNLDGMKSGNFLQKKRDFEGQLMDFVNENAELKSKYGTVLEDIYSIYKQINATRDFDYALGQFQWLAGTMNRLAQNIYYIAKEREKAPEERDPSFSEKDIQKGLARLQYSFMSYDEGVDKALFKRALTKALELPEGQQIAELKAFMEQYESVDAFLDQAYQKSKMSDLEFVKTLYTKPSAELDAMDDPFIQLAKALYPLNEKKKEDNKKIDARLSELRKKYIDLLLVWKGDKMYPDANGTVRLTYGVVSGYSPRDAVSYKPFTTLSGVIEKDTGEFPFKVPQKLKDLYREKDYGQWFSKELVDVPVAFTHECDITGGNSGSPVMNANGDLIGIAFDGNYEALTSDWQYNPKLQRAISVDIRYVMFITEKYAGADYLLKEMGVK